MHFKKNSLASFAFIQTTEKQKKYSQGNSVLDIRTIVHLNSHIEKVVEKDDPGWQSTDSLVVVKYSRNQSSYEDPTCVFPANCFPYRSTLVKDSEGNWKVLEISKRYANKREPFENVDNETEAITALSSRSIPLCILGVPVSSQERSDQEGRTSDYWCIENGGKELVRYHSTPRTTRFSPEAVKGIPVEISNLEQKRKTIGECIYGLNLYEDEDLWQGDINPAEEPFPLPWYGQTRFDLKEAVLVSAQEEGAKAKPKAKSRPVLDPVPEEAMEVDEEAQAPAEMVEVKEDSFYHEGVEYNATKSSLKELQALCREYQLKTQGSKKQLLSRLATAVREERLGNQLQQRRQDYHEHVVPFQQQPTSKPSEEEVEMHNLTHLPFQPWCEHCVATRAKEDPHKQAVTKATSSDDSSKPWLSFDFCYTSTSNCTDPPAVALVMTDNWSSQASISHMVEGIVHFSTQLGYSSICLKADNEGSCKAVKEQVQRKRGSLGLSTTLADSVPHAHETNGAAERALQTVRRLANTFLGAVRSKAKIDIPHSHPLVSWALKRSSWILNRFHKHSATQRTAFEIMTGFPYSGKLIAFGSSVMAKRLKVKRKGDRLWNVGIFLGKTESDLWLVGQPDGVHCVRSVRPLAENFDAERISNLSTHTWEIRQTLLGTRVLPHKYRTQPALAALPPVNAEEQQQLENNDEAATDPSDSDASRHSANTHSSGKLGSEAILAELEESIDDLQQEPPSPGAVGPVPAAAAASAAPPLAAAMELRSDGPTFEEVGSPSKIPRYRAPLPRAHPGATANISRAEVPLHDDDLVDEYYEDNESLYPNSDDDYVEQDEVYSEEAPNREQQQLPAKFFQEELGPPSIEEESLQALDDQATIKEVTRLTKMEVVELINIEGQEDDESKYLTTKLVLDWRFRDSDGFQLEEGEDSKAVNTERCWKRRSRLVAREYKTVEKRDDVFSPATSPALTKIIPMLCLAFYWSIWSVDVKDAFLQVPQKVKVLCRMPSEAEAIVAKMLGVAIDSLKYFRWKLKRVLPGQDFCDDLLKNEGLERSTANPALYRLVVIIDGRKVIRAVCIVHVDDLQFAGIIEVVVPLLERLQKKVKLQVEGPFLTPEEREAGYSLQRVRFLKRKFTYEDHELRISIDPKYVKKLTEVLQLDKRQSRKPKQTPCTSSSSEPDNSAALPPAEAATYRSAVGMLLYVAHDRPDIQFSVRSLSCGMKEPTEQKFKELQHLALYMKGAADYVAVFKKTKKGQSVLSASNLSSSQGGVPEEDQQHEGEHLLEVFSDSDWAGDKESRRSVSCVCMFLGGNYFFS